MYLYEYAHAMPPLAGGPLGFEQAVVIPGGNVSYKRRVFESASMADSLWELDFHAGLFRKGALFVRNGQMLAEFSHPPVLPGYVAERYRISYEFAALRAASMSAWRCVGAALARAVLPMLVVARIVMQVVRKRRRRLRLVMALPWIVLFALVQTAAEAASFLSSARAHGRRRAGWEAECSGQPLPR